MQLFRTITIAGPSVGQVGMQRLQLTQSLVITAPATGHPNTTVIKG